LPEVVPLAPALGARVTGIDLEAGVPPAAMAALREALARHQVLVLPAQHVTDAAQIAFSEGFGPLETTRAGADGAGSKLIVLSNIGPDGAPVAPTHRQVLNNRANQSWHHDSSFKPAPARISILSAREIPATGGNTEFASMRAAFAALDPAEQQRLRPLHAIHDFAWSRRRVDPALVTEAEAAAHPPVRQPVVRTENPNGPALYLGAHARSIEGLPEPDSRALIDRLMAHATQPGFTYSHAWSPGDVLVWDNRAVLHRATPFAAAGADRTPPRRRMVRTTVAG
jgi:alpha-ketoglutarate-dependent 2,4-dichlorophenoxyacetate dioxygenase